MCFHIVSKKCTSLNFCIIIFQKLQITFIRLSSLSKELYKIFETLKNDTEKYIYKRLIFTLSEITICYFKKRELKIERTL